MMRRSKQGWSRLPQPDDDIGDTGTVKWTVVFLHAHPDDEALLTGGTMARLSAEGHRVVLVTATAGELGMASTDVLGSGALAEVRLGELRSAADLLGCARTVVMGYRDSGSAPTAGGVLDAFADMDVDIAAARLAEILREEAADALTIYDPAGGYGHPDHVQVHRVGVRAAHLAGTALVLEATVNRRPLQRALSLARWFVPRTPDFSPSRFAALFADPDRITHRVDVTRFLGQKRAAMQAHHSQTTANSGIERGLAWMLRLPRPLYRLVFGHEWFVEHGRVASGHPLDDLLATLRSR